MYKKYNIKRDKESMKYASDTTVVHSIVKYSYELKKELIIIYWKTKNEM